MPRTRTRPRLHVDVDGAADGEPLLVLSGFALSGRIFDPVLSHWTSRFRVVRYDHRASARSATTVLPTSMQQLAADAVRVLDDVGLGSAHVIGLSFGGLVAQELALRHPDRVRGLVLVGATCGGPRGVRPTASGVARLGRDVTASAVRDRAPLLPLLFSDDFRAMHHREALRRHRPFMRHPSNGWGVTQHWWASVYHDTWSRLPGLAAPTLVLHGSEDRLSPVANAHLLAERIPDAELVVADGCGHAVPLERPAWARDVVVDWLDRRSPGPGEPLPAWRRAVDLTTRPVGLQLAALRTGVTLAGVVAERVRR